MKHVLFGLIVSVLPNFHIHAQSATVDEDTQQAIDNTIQFMQVLKKTEQIESEKIRLKVEQAQQKLVEQKRLENLMHRRINGDYTATHELAEQAYIVNSDGTVYDPAFNITWMRCSLGQEWDGETCIGSAKTYKSFEVNAEVKKIQFADKNDWRLPNQEELSSLIYCSSGKKSKNGSCKGSYQRPTIINSIFPNTPASMFGATFQGMYLGDWGVRFKDGDDSYWSFSIHLSKAIRLVRNGK